MKNLHYGDGPEGALRTTLNTGDALVVWLASAVTAEPLTAPPAPGPDPCGYRFVNGFVAVGDLPGRAAFRRYRAGHDIALETGWPVESLRLALGDRRVGFSTFRRTATHLRRWYRTVVEAPAAFTAPFRLITRGGVRLWVNGELVLRFDPFTRDQDSEIAVAIPLNAGANELILHSEDIAERDIDWFFELAYEGATPLISAPPVATDAVTYRALTLAARSIRPARDVFAATDAVEFRFDAALERDVSLEAAVVEPEQSAPLPPARRLSVPAGRDRIAVFAAGALPAGHHVVNLKLRAGGLTVERAIPVMLFPDLVPPSAAADLAERKRETLRHLARHGNLTPGRVLAAFETGIETPDVIHAILERTLDKIERREDCCDFHMVTVLWIWAAHAARLPAGLVPRIRRAILDWRYWVDEPGNDVMWFWSENHTLCFHVSQLLAGGLFPDEVFTTSGRTGREQKALAADRLGCWLDAVETHGLVEWNSAAYYPIDGIGLFAVLRWGDPPLAERARRLLDRLFVMIGLHTVAGVPVGSMGRAYDRELRAGPVTELAGFCRVVFGEGWFSESCYALALLCATDYAPPAEAVTFARPRAETMLEARYTQGHDHAARLVVCKTGASQLSTVVDHRQGTHGHQQHVVDLKLAGHPFARMWVNHPGEEEPWGAKRPSYWAGNGVLPRVAQDWDTTLMLFRLGEVLPAWTHAFVAAEAMDEVIHENGWLIARSGDGYGALWASSELSAMTAGAFAGQEYRAPGVCTGWAGVIGCGRSPDDFQRFRRRLAAAVLTFDETRCCLTVVPPGGKPLVLDWSAGLSIGGTPAPFTALSIDPAIRHAGDGGAGPHFA